MKTKQPVNLNLFTIRFPVPAIVSILHRISGILLFLAIPFILYLLKVSLASEESFLDLRQSLVSPLSKGLMLCLLAAFFYHFVAGIRHLFMDMGCGDELANGRKSAIWTLLIVILLVVLTGIWLW